LYFAIISDFLLDSLNTKLIRYFGTESNIFIPRSIQTLCSSCFSCRNSLSSISFETDSELTRIESKSFDYCCSLKSITIPRHVQILCSSYFTNCNSLSSISFETDSELTHIEARALETTSLSLAVLPVSVLFVAGNAFSIDRTVALTSGDQMWRSESGLGVASSPQAKHSSDGLEGCESRRAAQDSTAQDRTRKGREGRGRGCDMIGSWKT
jgi:hypothetical protein